MKEGELSKSLKFALFLLGLFSVLSILVGGLMLFCSIVFVLEVQEGMTSPSEKVISAYMYYFVVVAIGFSLYLTGRILYFICFVVKVVNTQIFHQNEFKNKLLKLGQETCFVIIFTAVPATVLSVAGNILNHRPLSYYTVVIAWLIIITFCIAGNYLLGKKIAPETNSSVVH